MTKRTYRPEDLEDLNTLCTGQCCSLKIDDGTFRVWLCRVAGGVSIERFNGRQWRLYDGGCAATSASLDDERGDS